MGREENPTFSFKWVNGWGIRRKWSVPLLWSITAAARSVHPANRKWESSFSCSLSKALLASWRCRGRQNLEQIWVLCLIDKKGIVLHKVYKRSPCHMCLFIFFKCNGKNVFYLFRSMHFKSFKNKQKELFLKHKDQRELISSHSYFFRCFLLCNVIFFFFFSKWCPGWKRNLYLNVCLIHPLLFKKLCIPVYLMIRSHI